MISAVIKFEDNRISIHSSATKQVGTKFDKGFYIVSKDQAGNFVIVEDVLRELHNPYRTKENEVIVDTVEGFFRGGIKEKVKALGFVHKLGILVYGKQGTGKTSMLHFIAKKLEQEQNAIIFFCNSGGTLSAGIALSKMIREIQENPIIFIADEFERYAKEYESEMKNFLDGNESIDNMLFLAATNYIEKVPDTLKDRPSRFKVVQETKGITDKKLMARILEDISNRIQPFLFSPQEIDSIVAEMEDVTLDEIKHTCLDKLTNTFVPKQAIRNTIGFKAQKALEAEELYTDPFKGLWFSIGAPTITVTTTDDE